MIRCPLCFGERVRFKERGWFMRHLTRFHGLSINAALNYWFDACGQLTLPEVSNV